MSKIVKLNVGGKHFETTEMTLKSVNDSMLAVMIQQPNEMEKITQGQELFIDRDGEYFCYVLNYLRNGDQMTIPQENTVRGRLIDEANFYQLPGLTGLIKEANALKVGDIVQLRDSDAARGYFDSVMTKLRGGRHSWTDSNIEYVCWVCLVSSFELNTSCFGKWHEECRNSKNPIKYDTLVGKIADIDGQCAMVTVMKGCLMAIFGRFLACSNDEKLLIHIPLAFLKLLNQ